MKVKVNENLVADWLYEQVKDIPEFARLGMDQQGEFITTLLDKVDEVMVKRFPPINFETE